MLKKTTITNSIVYLFLIFLLFAGCSGIPDGYTYGAHGQLTTIEESNNSVKAGIIFILLGFLSIVYDNFKKR